MVMAVELVGGRVGLCSFFAGGGGGEKYNWGLDFVGKDTHRPPHKNSPLNFTFE